MKTEWSEESCGSTKPERFQKLNENSYMQRKNIVEETTEDENGQTVVRYHCLSRVISKDVYEDFVDALDDPAQLELMNEFRLVHENFQASDENSIAMMSAIADIYEMNL